MRNKKLQQHFIVALTSPHLIQLCAQLLKNLAREKIISHLVIAKKDKKTATQLLPLADYSYDDANIAASIASGSFKTAGMLILGYSEMLLYEINSGMTKSLIARAADVILKERRRLVYVIEKAPWEKNMLQQFNELTTLGGVIFPLVPAFYNNPDSINAMIQHACARMLDLFALDIKTPRWSDN